MNEDRVGEQVRTDSRMSRTIGGLIIAPILGGIATSGILALIAVASGIFDTEARPLNLESVVHLTALMVTQATVFGLMLGVPIAFVIGWPAHRLLMHFRKVGAVSYLAAITAVSTIGYAVLCLSSGVDLFGGYRSVMLAAVTCWGRVSGLVFWLIRRPDRDAPRANIAG